MIHKIERLKELASSLNSKLDTLIDKQNKLHSMRNQVVNQFRKDFEVGTVTNPIATWDNTTWVEFDKEATSLVGTASSCMTADWEEYFLLEKEKADQLKLEIAREDKEINRILDELHSLTQKRVVI